jgi:1-acyl-sn-glycerol-3-phosphate acyltransferase
LTAALGRSVLRFLGWRIEGSLPSIPRCVVIVAPHTSNWDFVLGLSAILVLRVRLDWLGKDAIFRFPFRRLLAWLGGIPVNRRSADKVVEDAAHHLLERDRLFLGLAPEGTRKKVERWKSGFYRIAHAAGVPIFLTSLDYRSRVLGLGPLVQPTGDYEADLRIIQARYTSAMARVPESYQDAPPVID